MGGEHYFVPESVRILALSATMGNVVDIQGWINSIHGPTSLVQSTHRPVPLKYMFALRQGIMPLFKDPQRRTWGCQWCEKEVRVDLSLQGAPSIQL